VVDPVSTSSAARVSSGTYGTDDDTFTMDTVL
jgi:hypothetical protein